MIGLDTNVLIDYLVADQPEHARVRAWMRANTEQLATTSINVGEVLRLLTHPRVFRKPLTLRAALRVFEELCAAQELRCLAEADDWPARLSPVAASQPSIRGNEIFDARIALTLAYHGVRKLLTRDSDFAKYEFLEVVRP